MWAKILLIFWAWHMSIIVFSSSRICLDYIDWFSTLFRHYWCFRVLRLERAIWFRQTLNNYENGPPNTEPSIVPIVLWSMSPIRFVVVSFCSYLTTLHLSFLLDCELMLCFSGARRDSCYFLASHPPPLGWLVLLVSWLVQFSVCRILGFRVFSGDSYRYLRNGAEWSCHALV